MITNNLDPYAMEDHFGRKVMRILKPSPDAEAFLGFDLGFGKSRASAAELRAELRSAIAAQSITAPNLYVGYFLQCPVA